VSDVDFFKWVEELLAIPPSVEHILKERTRTGMILSKAAEEFVREIFKKLDYEVTPQVGIRHQRFDLLAQKKDKHLLVEVKLKGRTLNKEIFNILFQGTEKMEKKYNLLLVTFDRSGDVKNHKERYERYFVENSRFDWVSVEDLLGLSGYRPSCGSLEKDIGIALLRNWRNKMIHSTAQYFKDRGLERPREIASNVIKVATDRKDLIIDDFDIVRTFSEKIKDRYPEYFESIAFFCKNCNKRYRMTPVIWSERKKEYVLLCPECKEKIERVYLQAPIVLKIQMVLLDTSAIIEGVFSKLMSQKFFQEGIFVIIPEVVDQELEIMEKPHPSISEQIKRDLRRKSKMAYEEIQRLVKQEVEGLIQLRRHVGQRLNEDRIRLKIECIDRYAPDRLLIETCKEIGALLVTKDEGLATRASADKISVFLVSTSPRLPAS